MMPIRAVSVGVKRLHAYRSVCWGFQEVHKFWWGYSIALGAIILLWLVKELVDYFAVLSSNRRSASSLKVVDSWLRKTCEDNYCIGKARLTFSCFFAPSRLGLNEHLTSCCPQAVTTGLFGQVLLFCHLFECGRRSTTCVLVASTDTDPPCHADGGARQWQLCIGVPAQGPARPGASCLRRKPHAPLEWPHWWIGSAASQPY